MGSCIYLGKVEGIGQCTVLEHVCIGFSLQNNTFKIEVKQIYVWGEKKTKQNPCVWRTHSNRASPNVCLYLWKWWTERALPNSRPGLSAESQHNEDIDQWLCVWLWYKSHLINEDLAVMRVTKAVLSHLSNPVLCPYLRTNVSSQRRQMFGREWGKTMDELPFSQMGKSAEEDAWVWHVQTPPQCCPELGNIRS